jgi:hypothetical protein
VTGDGISPFGLPQANEVGGAFFSTDSLEEQLIELAPEIHERVAWLLNRLAVDGSLFAHRAPSHAAAVVVNQALNDGQDMLIDLTRLRGRPATRAARALVEHVINLRTIIADPVAADRYVSHGAVAAQVEAEARIGLTRLQGGEHRAERHRLRKLARDSAAQEREALERFGASYRRSWAAESLFERAGRVGLRDLYGYYRLSSMVLHGAVGGAVGTVSREHRQPVHRAGPSLQLCVSAYHEGLRSLAVLGDDLSATPGLPDMTPLLGAIEAVADYWPKYRRAVLVIDRHLWPRDAPPGPVAVLCIFRSGVVRWYWHEPRLGVMVEADPPAQGLSAEQEAYVREVRSSRMRDWDDRDVCVSIAMLGVTVNPRPDKPALPDAALLVPRSSGRLLEEPLEIPLDSRE